MRSSIDLASLGLGVLLLYTVCELAGLRHAVSLLSGTVPPDTSMLLALSRCVLYVLARLGAIALGPALLLAALLRYAAERYYQAQSRTG